MRTLILGGSGELGRHLKKFFPDADCPSSTELDVRMPFPSLPDYKLVINAAASVNKKCTNIEQANTNNSPCPAAFCVAKGCKYVYISTEYVFGGDRGAFGPTDKPIPSSLYGWSKLSGETAASWVANHLIIRASFMPDPFPYDKAYTNQISSKIPTAEAAEKIFDSISACGIIHICGPIRSIYDYAVSRGAKVAGCEMKPGEDKRPMNSSLVER